MSEHPARVDVVVVGAGIAGSALAASLARHGVSVLVLERSSEYVDRVRGEFMTPWGVAEAQRLGVYDDLLAAGANFNVRFVPYDEAFTPAEAEAAAVAIDVLVPGVPGALTMEHRVACTTLDAAARAAGATVGNGVEVLEVVAGGAPVVRYTLDGVERAVSCRLVVGADGRESFVRKSLGIDLQRNEARLQMGGLLVDGVRDWPEGDFVISTEAERMCFVFPQHDGRARLYLAYLVENKQRLAGANKTAAFLEAFRVSAIPDSDRFADATPAGPCAAYAMHDSWTDTPAVEGAVLIGDAAGYSDPTIGQGLSIAMRDARAVRDVLAGGDDWSVAAFADFTAERNERMRRLRFCVETFTDIHMPLGPGKVDERRRRLEMQAGGDMDLFMLAAAQMMGPEVAPPTCFEPAVRERLLTLA